MQIKLDKILIGLLTSVIALVTVIQANAQAISETPTTATVELTAKTLPAKTGDSRILPLASSQNCVDFEDCATKLTKANQRINQLLDEIELGTLALKSSQAETEAQKLVVAKADERIRGLLDVIKEYASVPEKERKSWWQKVKKRLVDIIDVATDPRTIRTIAEIILLIKATER